MLERLSDPAVAADSVPSDLSRRHKQLETIVTAYQRTSRPATTSPPPRRCTPTPAPTTGR